MRDVTCEESRQQYNFIINQVSDDASDNGRWWTMAQNKFSGSDILCYVVYVYVYWQLLTGVYW